LIAWDTETRSFRWWENPAFLGSWDTGEGGQVAVLPEHGGERASRVEEFRNAIANETHHVGANIKFDAHMARAESGVEIFKPGNRVDDILMRSRLLYGNTRASHGLEALGDDLLPDAGKAAAKAAMQERYKQLTGRSDMAHEDAYYIAWQHYPDEVEKYAAEDASDTLALERVLSAEMKKDAKLERLYEEVERPVTEVLYNAEKLGVQVDPEAVERLTRHYQERDTAARSALESTLGFVPEGEGSEDALREGLLRAGVPLTEVTEVTGELAVNRRALGKFADHPAVAALFEFRRVNKFLQTYILPLTGTDHIHPTFNQAQAWTGRMSGSNPNMQNLPKRTELSVDENLRVRSVFVPRPGYEFIVADFDSIEMRVLAYYLGDKAYRELIRNGDPHAITAAAGWGGNPEQYYKGTDMRWLRDIAKQDTYAIVYGGGGPVIMDTTNKLVADAGHPDYRIDLDQARALRRKITGAIPGFKALTDSPYKGKSFPKGRLYQQLERSLVDVNGTNYGYVRTLMGRKQWISFDKAYVALSGLIQGSAADIMKAAAINVREAMKPYGGAPILFVHDEMAVEVPLGWGEKLLPVVVDAMEQAVSIDPPLKVEAYVTKRSYAHHE
jgi:DNA polymerase-1